MAGRIPFDDALALAACGVDRDVFERPHLRNLGPGDAWTRPLAIHAVAAMRGAKCIRFLSLREFGKAVGADAYCRDAAIAVETAKDLIERVHNRPVAD